MPDVGDAVQLGGGGRARDGLPPEALKRCSVPPSVGDAGFSYDRTRPAYVLVRFWWESRAALHSLAKKALGLAGFVFLNSSQALPAFTDTATSSLKS